MKYLIAALLVLSGCASKKVEAPEPKEQLTIPWRVKIKNPRI